MYHRLFGRRPVLRRLSPLLFSACLASCTGAIGPAEGPGGSVGGHVGGTAGQGGRASGAGGNAGATGNAGAPGGVGGLEATSLLPADVRRLTNAEYDSSVQALLGTSQRLAATTFPPDSAQSGYTLNEGQVVASVMAKQLDAAAVALVAEARKNGQMATLAPCANATSQGATCAATFITSFGAAAYRRALTADEQSGLLTVYQVGASNGGAYADGIDLVARAILQSPGFLYITELGDPSATGPTIDLTPDELASTMAYLLTAAPPDQMLLDSAAGGLLSDPTERESQARRLLLGTATSPPAPGAQGRMVRLIREWLEIDGIGQEGKDTNWYPDFTSLNAAAVMDAEATSFIAEVLDDQGTVQELLSAPWTMINPGNAVTAQDVSNYYSKFYGVTPGTGETSLAGALGGARIGILNQGAFPATYAHASTSAPVLRGVAIMRRLACINVPDPTTINLTVPPPPAADPSMPKTTRDLFDVHGNTGGGGSSGSSNSVTCATCHISIDAFGFAFEGYDGMGEYRTIDLDQNGAMHLGMEKVASTRPQAVNGYEYLPINTASTVTGGGADLNASYADSNALAMALSVSSEVAQCVATHVFRGSTGRSDSTGNFTPSELAFQNIWSQLSPEDRGKFAEIVIAYVASPLFAQRRIP